MQIISLEVIVGSTLMSFTAVNMQVKETLLQKCQEVEQTAREQATDNAILDQLRKVIYYLY